MAFDLTEILSRVADAVAKAGATPWLIGYDANSIQELVTSSGRPISMRGASEAILGFDKAVRKDELPIFTGGGRGVVLARSREAAEQRARDLVQRYRAATRGGAMASCAVPLDRAAEGQSIRWLRHRLEIAKDEASPPGGLLPQDKAQECEYCHRYLGENERTRDERMERLCAQCAAMLDRGHDAERERGERFGVMSNSIADMAKDGWIAAISADGNNLGAMFESLGSLTELAVVSEAVADIFQTAESQARAVIEAQRPHHLPLLTGGDDVRAFIAPDTVLGYVQALTAGVEAGAASHADAARAAGVISPAIAKALRNLGIGIGAVIASVYYPARRLIQYAHDLERTAKQACRANDWRSGFDFAIVTNEDAMFEQTVRTGSGIAARPLPPGTSAWTKALHRARSLAAIPRAQIAALAATAGFVDEPDAATPPGAPPEHDELANLLRYQVARSSKWQAWYEACDVDWRNPTDVVRNRPTRDMIELARLLAFGGA